MVTRNESYKQHGLKEKLMMYLLFCSVIVLLLIYSQSKSKPTMCDECSMKELCKECRRNGNLPPCEQ